MTGRYRRLLAALPLIFAASAFPFGQEAATDRSPDIAPINLAPPRYFPPTTPIPIPPPPIPPWRYPIGGNPVGRNPKDPGPIVFHQMIGVAGIIFSGRVTSVGHAYSSYERNPASTTITFQVEHAIRGTSPGENLTIHEWAGLWPRGERYRVGESVLLFLYSPGKLGFTSPVAAALGRFEMDSQGKVVMDAQHVQTLTSDPILGGKTAVPYNDFELAVRRSCREASREAGREE